MLGTPLSFDDLQWLLAAFPESYANWPKSVQERILSVIRPITTEWMHPIITAWMKHKLARDSEIESVLMQINGQLLEWATLSILIGAEAGNGQITEGEVPHLLLACGLPVQLQLSSYLDGLVSRRRIKDRQADKMAKQLDQFFTEKSVSLANWGHVMHGELQPKYAQGELSPLTARLRQIDLSQLAKP
jgi:hypothetical protein